MPVTFLHFVGHLCNERKRWWIRIGYGIALLFVVVNSTPFMVTGVKPAFDFPSGPGRAAVT